MTPTTITKKLFSYGFDIITILRDNANKDNIDECAYVLFERYDPKSRLHIRAKLDNYTLALYNHGVVFQVNLIDLNEINFFTENDQWYAEIISDSKLIKLALY